MIRAAGAWDVSAIAKIWNAVIHDADLAFDTVDKAESDLIRLFAARSDAGRGSFVIEEDGEVLGFATYDQFRPGSGYGRTMEHRVMVAPDARRGGHGRALLEAVEAHARAAGAHSIIAGISAGNADALAFHKALSYAEIARLPEAGWKSGKLLDLALVQKSL